MMKVVAWEISVVKKIFDFKVDKYVDAVLPSLEWGIVIRRTPTFVETRRLSDGKKWAVPYGYIVEDINIRNEEEMKEFEKDFPNWWEKIIKARAKGE